MTWLPGLHCPPVEACTTTAVLGEGVSKFLPRSTTATLLTTVPFLSPKPPCLPLDKEKTLETCSLPAITLHAGLLECAFTDQRLPVFPEGYLSRGTGWRGLLWCPSGFLKCLLCVPGTPQTVASDSFPCCNPLHSERSRHWLFTTSLPG